MPAIAVKLNLKIKKINFIINLNNKNLIIYKIYLKVKFLILIKIFKINLKLII